MKDVPILMATAVRICLLAVSLFITTTATRLSVAGDWPQILGPHRNGQASGETLATTWPKGGPERTWSYPLGSGFAGPAVAGGKVVVFHRVGDAERVEALDAPTGRSLWATDFPATYRGGVNPDQGPRCVPLIHQGYVYLFGAAGDLHCVSLANGRKRWSREARSEYAAPEGYFGAGSTPIVADNKLLVNVGGRDGAGLVAFALDSGRTLWKTTNEGASYSSPTSAMLDGQQHVIFVTRLNTVSIDPRNGREHFRFPFGQRGPTVNAATPLVFDHQLFVSAAYGVGAKLARIENGQASTIWSSDEVMSSQYTTCVYHQRFLYGVHGREDVGRAVLRCLEAETGKVRWTAADFGMAHLILAGDQLLILKVAEGELVLADASPDRFRARDSAQVSPELTRALPALSNGRLFIRSTPASTRGQLICLSVGASAGKR